MSGDISFVGGRWPWLPRRISWQASRARLATGAASRRLHGACASTRGTGVLCCYELKAGNEKAENIKQLTHNKLVSDFQVQCSLPNPCLFMLLAAKVWKENIKNNPWLAAYHLHSGKLTQQLEMDPFGRCISGHKMGRGCSSDRHVWNYRRVCHWFLSTFTLVGLVATPSLPDSSPLDVDHWDRCKLCSIQIGP